MAVKIQKGGGTIEPKPKAILQPNKNKIQKQKLEFSKDRFEKYEDDQSIGSGRFCSRQRQSLISNNLNQDNTAYTLLVDE